MRKEMLLTLGTAALAAALFSIPAVAAEKTTNTIPYAWPPESLAGTIVNVLPDQHIVIVKDASGVPFDMVVNRSTRIESGNRKVNLGDLSSDVNRKASIRFVPQRDGDIARVIQIKG